jgi:hypothetical protein
MRASWERNYYYFNNVFILIPQMFGKGNKAVKISGSLSLLLKATIRGIFTEHTN